jgi:hypothetical protein
LELPKASNTMSSLDLLSPVNKADVPKLYQNQTILNAKIYTCMKSNVGILIAFVFVSLYKYLGIY